MSTLTAGLGNGAKVVVAALDLTPLIPRAVYDSHNALFILPGDRLSGHTQW